MAWLWSALRSFTDEQKAKFLQFVTGACPRPRPRRRTRISALADP